jgi:predicted O-methyltransferase YrrM
MLLASLALSLKAEDILETGYDAAWTTMALAWTGASNIVAIDNLSEYQKTEPKAREMLSAYPNVTLLNQDALEYLRNSEDLAWDFIFIDDNHATDHVRLECMEVDRILRPGGIVAFHDTISHELWAVANTALPDCYQRIEIPCIQVVGQANGLDFGVGIFRKPGDRYRIYATDGYL